MHLEFPAAIRASPCTPSNVSMTRRRRCFSAAVIVVVSFLLVLLSVDGSHAKKKEAQPTLRRTSSGARNTKNVTQGIKINGLIDNHMDYIRGKMKEFDPRELKDIKRSLIKNVYALLHTGLIRHLSELKRSGDCWARYKNRVLTLDLNFEWRKLLFDYRYLINVLFVSQSGNLYGRMDDIKMNLMLDMDLRNHQIVLKRLQVDDAKRVKIWIEGRVFEKIYNLFLSAVTKGAKRTVLKIIEKTAAESIQLDVVDLNRMLGRNKLREFTFVNSCDVDVPTTTTKTTISSRFYRLARFLLFFTQ